MNLDAATYRDNIPRLAQTPTLRGTAYDRWRSGRLSVIGGGMLGQRFVAEAVLSGAAVEVCDFDSFSSDNSGTQWGPAGVNKADWLRRSMDRSQATGGHTEGGHRGRITARTIDVRRLGVGEFSGFDLIVDCSDDPALVPWLVRLSNGIGVPLLRAALDGSGQMEMGRVVCSHGAAETSCMLCPYSVTDLFRGTVRTPCNPFASRSATAPTLAGNAIASVIAGVALLQSQRIVGRMELDQVLGREIIVDLSHGRLLTIERPRVEKCLSGHRRWELTPIGRSASDLTLGELFQEAMRRLRTERVVLEPFGHALHEEARCECGNSTAAAGTQWAAPPKCRDCRRPMHWVAETSSHCLDSNHWLDRSQSAPQATRRERQRTMRRTLRQLGFPERGAMIAARAIDRKPLQMILSAGLGPSVSPPEGALCR